MTRANPLCLQFDKSEFVRKVTKTSPSLQKESVDQEKEVEDVIKKSESYRISPGNV